MNRSLNDPRYRPALIAVAGISAAYAIYLLGQRYFTFRSSHESQVPLRRRNALRRSDRSRPGRPHSSMLEEDSIAFSEQAVAALHARVAENRAYGYFDIHSVDQVLEQQPSRRRETQWSLLPDMLPTVEQFPETLRCHAETMFVGAFLVNELPPGHYIGPLESNYLQRQLASMGIQAYVVQECIEGFNGDPNYCADLRRDSGAASSPPPLADEETGLPRMGSLMEAIDGRETDVDVHSNFDWRDGNANTNRDRDGQNTLNLLYNIAADQARKDGYIHRGVECNGCGTMPIQGIRYRCANCLDFDLCESCEAQEIHLRTHVFYKIRVPAPSLGALGNSRQGLPVWYPGKPAAMPRTLPQGLQLRLLHVSGFDSTELDALWDQFRCLAGTEWRKDPNKLGMAVDRKTFDRCFVPPLSTRPPPPNLIYDRIFAFYDTNQDGLIGFEEFLTGLAGLNDKSRDGRLQRIFRGYDIDGDGYIDRKDFLRIFRAFYTLSKELNREMVAGMEEDLIDGSARDLIHGSQPISSAFPGSIPPGNPSRSGMGKEVDSNGDLVIVDSRGILDDDADQGTDRNRFIADAAVHRRSPSRESSFYRPGAWREGSLPRARQVDHIDHPLRQGRPQLEEETLPSHHHNWPPDAEIQPEDIAHALGGQVPLVEIMDPVDRARVVFAHAERLDTDTAWRRHDAVQERWRRRRFYTDVEEGATAPPGYSDADGSDGGDFEAGDVGLDSVTSASMSRPVSPRSRSSSKVRFEDSVTDTDYETRSNTSSRSIPVGERWGGYEVNEMEKDVGKEILYQTVQQGFNELLDQLFKQKEDLAMEAHKSRKLRRDHAKEIEDYTEWLRIRSINATSLAAATKAKKAENRSNQVDTSPDKQHSPSHTAPSSPGLPRPLRTENPDRPTTSPPSPITATPNTGTSSDNESSFQDPTLPQFRPDDPNPSNPAPRPAHPLIFGTPANYTISSKHLLQDLQRDEQTEEEACGRGGFGRLNYDEFVRGMCGDEGRGDEDEGEDAVECDDDDDDDDADADAEDAGGAGTGTRTRRGGGEGRAGSRKREEKNKKKKEWEGGGGMGKLGFVGSWIEIAGF